MVGAGRFCFTHTLQLIVFFPQLSIALFRPINLELNALVTMSVGWPRNLNMDRIEHCFISHLASTHFLLLFTTAVILITVVCSTSIVLNCWHRG